MFRLHDNQIRTPDEILKTRKGMLNMFVRNTISELANQLAARYIGEPVRITLAGDPRQFRKIFPEIEKEFGAKGWKVSIESSDPVKGDVVAQTAFLISPKSTGGGKKKSEKRE